MTSVLDGRNPLDCTFVFDSSGHPTFSASALEVLATDMRLPPVCARFAFVELGQANGKWPRSINNFKRARVRSQHVSKESFGF
jgi:hypothetical protein